MERQTFETGTKTAVLYPAAQAGSPLIVLCEYEGDGMPVVRALQEMGAPACSLLVTGGGEWNRDMSPWAAPAVFKGGEPFTGGADGFLTVLLGQILPEGWGRIGDTPAFTGLAGYSLAGLFALYALCRCDAFDRAASVSGSLWFPGFTEYVLTHEPCRRPEMLYFSLGDRESRTANPVLRTAERCMTDIASHYAGLGIPVIREMNPGNHFRDEALRTAKGIRAMLAYA